MRYKPDDKGEINLTRKSPVPTIKFDRRCEGPVMGIPLMKFGDNAESTQHRVGSEHLWNTILYNVSKISKNRNGINNSMNTDDIKDEHMTNMINSYYNNREMSYRIRQAHTYGVHVKEHGNNYGFKLKVEYLNDKVMRHISPKKDQTINNSERSSQA